MDYRYKLESYTGRNSRHTCPGCKKPHQFTRYINSDTGIAVASHVGKCNRINKCGYHYTPKQYFHDNGITYPDRYLGDLNGQAKTFLPLLRGDAAGRGVKVPDYISKAIFLRSLSSYENNNFIKYLHERFDAETVNQLIRDYHIGTSSLWNGGTTVYWQVDIEDNVRTGKLIKYQAESGKREKNKTNWAHTVLGLHDFNLKQCLFGEHLLNLFPHKTIGIVESEKTAILASVFLPGLLWLASGGANGLSKDKIKVLIGRKVILFPDASETGHIYESWKEIANKYGFACSDFIEKNATNEQKAQGIDIADMLESVTVKFNKIRKPKKLDPITTSPEVVKQNGLLGCLDLKEKHLNEFNNETFKYPKATPQIPYNTPSLVAIIDSQINTQKVLKGEDMIIGNRDFTTASGDKMELVGIRDYGYCGNYDEHKKQKGYCRECILNCLHTIKINGELQKREYTHLELLLMQ